MYITVLGLWPSPLSSALDTLQGFQRQGSLAGGDLLEYFPSLTRMTESLSLLNSGASSPVDSETSVVSSGSDHLVSKKKVSFFLIMSSHVFFYISVLSL